MHRHIQGETFYMCDQFGVNGKVCWSYKDFLLHGKALKSTTLPGPPGIMSRVNQNGRLSVQQGFCVWSQYICIPNVVHVNVGGRASSLKSCKWQGFKLEIFQGALWSRLDTEKALTLSDISIYDS